MVDTVLVSIDTSHGEGNEILLIGRKTPGEAVTIINAFEGQEALDLYSKLITTEKKPDITVVQIDRNE